MVASDETHDIGEPEELVAVAQLFRSFKSDGAEANYLEKTTGSTEVDKSADLSCSTRT